MQVAACSCRRNKSHFWTAVVLLALTAASAAATAAVQAAATNQDAPPTDCSSTAAARFNFFPANTKNLPEGWSLQNQRHAGNTCSGQLLPIALYGAPKPRLYFQPLHDLLRLGAAVDLRQWITAAAPVVPPQSPAGSPLTGNVTAAAANTSTANSSSGGSSSDSKVDSSRSSGIGLFSNRNVSLAAIAKGVGNFGFLNSRGNDSRRVWVEKDQVFSIASFTGRNQAPPPAPKPTSDKPRFTNPMGPLLDKLRGRQQSSKSRMTPSGRNKVLQTFIQVLLTGNAPDEIEVAEVKGMPAAQVAAAAATGSTGRPQPLRAVSIDRGNGAVEHYTSRDRILLEEFDLSSSSNSSAEVADSVNLGSLGSAFAAWPASSQPAALQERGMAQGGMQAFGARGGTSRGRQALPEAVPSASKRGPFLPWSRDRPPAPTTGSSSNKRLTGGLPALLQALGKLGSAAADGGDAASGSGNSSTSTTASSSLVSSAPWMLLREAAYVYSVTVSGRPWFSSQVHHNASVAMVDFHGNVTAGRRDIFDSSVFSEGINTVVINVTLLAGSALAGNGTHNITLPSSNVTFNSPEIDFYFFMWSNATHDSRPSAVVQFESCKAEASIKFSKARPTPVLIDGYRLTYRPVPARTTAFFLPVYHVYGQFEKGLDGSTDLHTDNTEGNIKNFGLYLTRLPGSPQDFSFSGPSLDALKEGWWHFSVEGSLWVPLPHLAHLLSLSGIDRYGNRDVLYRQVQRSGKISDGMSLLNSIKGAGWVLPEYSSMRVGLQKAVTTLDYFEGPSAPLVLGDKAMFSWAWSGLDAGTSHCRIEGRGTVSLAGTCSSPFTYTVRTNLNQTLTIGYKDVCGKNHNASLTFGPSFGWLVDAKESGQGYLQLSTSGSPVPTLQAKNAGSSLRPARMQQLLVAAAAVYAGFSVTASLCLGL